MKQSTDSLLKALYFQHMEHRGPDREEINGHYEKLHKQLEELSRQQHLSAQCVVNELCAALEHIAFLDGVRTGAKLMLESME